MGKVGTGIFAIIAGVGASLLLFWLMNFLVERLPEKASERLKPWVFAGPAVLFITIFLVYPAVRTIYLSFLDGNGEEFVGLANYVDLLRDSAFHQTILNTILWLLVVPAMAVALGLLVAVLADRLAPTGEKVSKSLIFLPMAVSMVGASTIFRFVYAYKPPGSEQIGLFNAIWVNVFGGEPQVWLQMDTLRLNSFLLMIILIWLQVGYCMVLLPDRGAADLGHRGHGVRDRVHRCHEDLRHRLRDDRRQLQHQRGRVGVLQGALRVQQRRALRRDRRDPAAGSDAADVLPGPPVPG